MTETTDLESILMQIDRDVQALTKNEALRTAAANLLNDAREIAQGGDLKTAHGLAKLLSLSIPKYLRSRRPTW